MKTKKKAGVLLMAVALILATAVGAFALPYYQAGTSTYTTDSPTALTLFYSSVGVKAIKFTANPVSGPIPDNLVGYDQTISGIYTLGVTGTAGVYSLTTTGNSLIAVDSYITAQSKAFQIDFRNSVNGTISWEAVTGVSTDNTILGSTSLSDLAASSSYAFSTFNFQNSSEIATWLSGSSGTQYAKYYSKLEGFAAAPEPAEWMLMFIGLGMLGFYLQRRGYLDFDLSPQSVA